MKTLIFLFAVMTSVIATAETSEQIISRLKLNVVNLRVDLGGFCHLPGYKNVDRSCLEPMDKATDLVLTLQNRKTRMESMACDLKAAGQYEDVVCVVNIFTTPDSKGCPYQQAKYEIKVMPGTSAQLVSRTPYKYFCTGGGY